jgi:hypothetical protein
MLYLELTLPCIKVEAKQQCNSSSAKPTEQQQLGCVCAVLNLFLLPLVSPFGGVWNSPGRSIGAAGLLQLPTVRFFIRIANSTLMVFCVVRIAESTRGERPSVPTTGLERWPTAATCPGFRATRPVTVGGNRARRWTPTQQPPDCFPYFTIDPKLLPLL